VLLGGAWDFLFLGNNEKSSPQRTQRAQRREKQIRKKDLVALERKSPPFANYAKGGAPSSSFEIRWLIENPRGWSPSAPLRASKLRPTMDGGGVGQLRCGDTENE